MKATLHDELMREVGLAAEPEEAPLRHRRAVAGLRSAIAILLVLSLLVWGLFEIFFAFFGVPHGLPRALVWVLLPFAAIGFVGSLVLAVVRIERKR